MIYMAAFLFSCPIHFCLVFSHQLLQVVNKTYYALYHNYFLLYEVHSPLKGGWLYHHHLRHLYRNQKIGLDDVIQNDTPAVFFPEGESCFQ